MDLTVWNTMGQLKRLSGNCWEFNIFTKDIVSGRAWKNIDVYTFEYPNPDKEKNAFLSEWFKLHEPKISAMSPGTLLLVKF